MSGLIGKDVKKAAQILKDGGLVGIPTETVYGLAANALNVNAVTKIFEAKNRPTFDPLIIHLPKPQHLEKYTHSLPEWALKLSKHLWPGPITLILPKQDIVPDLVTSGLPNVAVRIPNHPLTQQLLQSIGFPLAAPSANPFGYISPTTAQHVADQLGDKVEYILDGGPSMVGLESTIVGMEDTTPMVFRKGGLPIEELERVIGKVNIKPYSSSRPQAPGMLEQHYAPRIPLSLGDLSELAKINQSKPLGVLAFQSPVKGLPIDNQRILSTSSNMREAAANLFAFLRELDALPIQLIIAEKLPEKGLGLAINDRLTRAAATHI